MNHPAPVLVLGAPGAGAATIAAALGRNRAAFYVPAMNCELEDTIYSMLFEMQGMRGVQLHGVLRALAYLLSGEQSADSVVMARRWLMSRLHLPSSELPRWFMERLSPLRLIQPVGSGLFSETARRRLSQTYSGADLVIVTRSAKPFERSLTGQHDGAAALLLGAYDRLGSGEVMPNPEALLDLAEEGMEHLMELMPHSRAHHVHLDDVLLDPEGSFARLCAELFLPSNPEALAPMLHPEEGPFSGPGPFGAHGRTDVHAFQSFERAAVAT